MTLNKAYLVFRGTAKGSVQKCVKLLIPNDGIIEPLQNHEVRTDLITGVSLPIGKSQ